MHKPYTPTNDELAEMEREEIGGNRIAGLATVAALMCVLFVVVGLVTVLA